MRSKLRLGHYSRRTEQACVGWVIRFVRHHRLPHPAELAEQDVMAFLRHLAEERRVAAVRRSAGGNGPVVTRCGIMPTAGLCRLPMSRDRRIGGSLAFAASGVGIIRGSPERPATGHVGGSGLV